MELFFRHFGEGRPLIILHGLFGMSDNWVTFAKTASEHFSVFIPDQRNHGQSPHSPVINYPALAEDLAEFIESHQITKPVLLGHSMGGKVAMQYTLDYPDLVDRLIVADIYPGDYPPNFSHLKMLQVMKSLRLGEKNSRSEVDRELLQQIPGEPERQLILKNIYWAGRNRMAWRLNIGALEEHIGALLEGISKSNGFSGPVLFIRGGKSDYIQKKHIPVIHSYFPDATLVTIEKATHWVHADQPAAFFEAVMGFLGQGNQA